MNVLETFYFMFEADASKVKDGLDAGEKAGEQLGKKLEDVDKQADRTGKSFLQMAKALGEVVAGYVALSVIKKTVEDTIDHTNAVAMQARALGTSTEALSLWQNAVKNSGGSAEEATATLSKLQDQIRSLTMHGGQSFVFEQLGLSTKDMKDAIKDPTVALLKMSETFGKLNNQQQLFLGKKLGLDVSTITLISKGRDGLEQYLDVQRRLGVVTQDQANKAAAYKMQLSELGTVYETVRRELTSDFLPALTWLMGKIEAVTLFFMDHKVATLAFFGAIAAFVVATYTPAIVSAAIATWSLIAPYAAVIAIVALIAAAFALVAEDVYNFATGQESLIGNVLKKWPVIGEIVKAIGQICKMTFDLIKTSLASLGNYIGGEASQVWSEYKKGVLDMIDALTKAFPWLKDAFKIVSDALNFEVKGLTDTFNGLWTIIKNIWDTFKNAPVAIINWIGKHLAAATGEKFDEVDPNAKPAPDAAAASPGKMGKGDAATGKEIADKLVASGKWTPAQAAGIAGSFLQESGGKADAKNPTSGAYGLGQWLGSRRKDFEQYSGKALEGSSLDDQIAFFNYETSAKGKEKRAGDMIRQSQTAADAAAAHSKYYERPGDAEANVARRQMLAQNIAAANTQLAQTNAPISSTNSMSIANANTSNQRNINVKTGPVTVTTAATDGNSTAAAIANHLNDHMRSAIDAHDDGVAA